MKTITTFLGLLFVLLVFNTNLSFCQENTPEEQYDGAKDEEQLPSSPLEQLEGLSPDPNPQVPEVPPPPDEVVPSTSTTTTTQDDNQKPEEKPSSNDNSGSKETQANPKP